MVDDIAVQEFIKAIKEPPTDTNTVYSATVSRVDTDGTVWVNIHGSDMETPTASTSAEVQRGDAVTVQWRNNKLYIGGNYSNPSAGVVRVANVEANAFTALDTASQAQFLAMGASTTANNAMISANGKNKVYRQSAQPSGESFAVGDIWFDTSNDNQISRWDGTSWVAFTLGDDAIGNLNASHINAGEIDASVITVSNIDAGNLTTGVLLADRIAGNSITASKIRIGDYRNYVTSTENDASSLISGQIVDGWVCKNVASNNNLWVSPALNNWTKEGEKYRVTGFVKMPAEGKFMLSIYGRVDDPPTYSASSPSQMSWMNNIPADTATPINSVITITSDTANCPKVNICVYFRTTSDVPQVGYIKQLRVERMSDSELIVDGSITADKIAVNAITIGKMTSNTTEQILNSYVEEYTDDVTATLAESFNDSLDAKAGELSDSIEDVRTLAGSKADATALSSLSTQMQEYIGEGGYIYANNGTLIIATGLDIGNFKIGIDGTQIVFYQNDNAVAYINNNTLYISRSEVTNEQKISNFAFKKRDGGRFTLMYVGGE